MVDVFVGPEGEHELRGPRISTSNTHGTGCSLCSAPVALWIGHGHGPVDHFYRLWSEK